MTGRWFWLVKVDDAFAEMELAYDRSNCLTLLKVDPKLDFLRTDQRFADLVQGAAHSVLAYCANRRSDKIEEASPATWRGRRCRD